jgi:alpha-glucosidase
MDGSVVGRYRDMISRLHRMGFKVMVWLVPFVSPDSTTFRLLESQGLLLRNSKVLCSSRCPQLLNGWKYRAVTESSERR